MKTGSLPWLLWHELQIWWRELRGKWFILISVLLFGLLLAGLMTVWVVAFASQATVREALVLHPIPAPLFWGAVVLWIIGFFYAFTMAMGQSVVALFDRGDLDLLISSPVSSKVIFASRLLGVALEVFLGFCLFVVPTSLLLATTGLWQLLGIYPALVGIVLTATSLAMLLTVGLVGRLGARRARSVAQILTLCLSGVFFLGLQLPNMLRGTSFSGESGLYLLEQLFGDRSPLNSQSWLWFPVKAVFLDLPAVILTLLLSGGLVWLTVETLHRSFLSGTQQSLTVKRSRLPVRDTQFSSSFPKTVLQKEWRIILRNPYLISQTFLSVLFLIPLLVIVLRNDSGRAIANFSTLIAVSSSLVGGSLVSGLTILVLSGEEAPDLLKSSPAKGMALRRLKLLAVLLPTWLLLSPLFLILILRGEPWLLPLVGFLGATLCTGLLRLWNARPISLAGLMSRRRQNPSNDVLMGFLEIVALYTWVFVAFQANSGNTIPALVGLGGIAVLMAIAYWRSRMLGTSLGF